MSELIKHAPHNAYQIGQTFQTELYNRKGNLYKKVVTVVSISANHITYHDPHDNSDTDTAVRIEKCKPILRRFDSMTDEEINIVRPLMRIENINFGQETEWLETPESIDWLDANGFDRPRLINGVAIESLIDAGLAVDAATLERSGK